MKLRLLFVIDNLQFGGGERVFAQIINRLPQEQYKIFLASYPNEEFLRAIHGTSLHYFSTDFSSRLNLFLIPSLAKIIRENEIRIVHGQGARAEFYARLASRLAGTSKYISTIAMPVEGFDVAPVRKRIYRFFDRISETFVDRFLVVSDALRQAMIEGHGIPAEKVIRIYNGVEIGHFSPQKRNEARKRIRQEFSVGENTLLVGAIGRLVWQKGFEYLVQAIPMVLNKFPKAQVLIVGEGPIKHHLEALSHKLKIGRHLIFAGFRKDIKQILSAIDMLVIPSVLEGFPIITLEGMAMTKPIIATNIDGIKEQIIDGKTGILIPHKDPSAIAEAILKLSKDEQCAQNIGWEARKRVEKEFSLEKMVNTTEQIYQSLISL